MTVVQAEIPGSLYRSACKLDEEEGIPLEHLTWLRYRNLDV